MLNKIIEDTIIKVLTGESTQPNSPPEPIFPFIGKKCMVRTYSAGVFFGEVEKYSNRECLVKDAYRVFRWDGACSLSQLAIEGSKDLGNCKIAIGVPKVFLSETIEVIEMSAMAYTQLSGAPKWQK